MKSRAFRLWSGLRVTWKPTTTRSRRVEPFAEHILQALHAAGAASLLSTGAEALLREQAQKKEASRLPGAPDYQNVADSFSFFDVNGSPAMSYFATFTRGDQVMTEHFIRVLSPRGYVMFFTTGNFEDVKVIMPQVKQAAATVKGP